MMAGTVFIATRRRKFMRTSPFERFVRGVSGSLSDSLSDCFAQQTPKPGACGLDCRVAARLRRTKAACHALR